MSEERTYSINYLGRGKTCAWRWTTVKAASALEAAKAAVHQIAKTGAHDGDCVVVTTDGSTHVSVFPIKRVPPPMSPPPPRNWTVESA